MYVTRLGKLYFYKYNYDKDIIIDDDLKYFNKITEIELESK